jgi:hypothetical protein
MIDFKKILSVTVMLLSMILTLNADDVLPKVVVKIGESSVTSDEYVKRLVEVDGNKTLENFIIERVIELELTEMKLPQVTDKQIDTHIALMEKQLQTTQGPYANINTFLKNQNIKMLEFRNKIKREIGLRRILGQAIEVKDEEILKYYEEFKGQYYTMPEARSVIAITVFDRESPAPKSLQTDRSVEEAKKIADGIWKSWSENKDYVKELWDTKQYFIRGYDQTFGVPSTMKKDKDYIEVFNTPIGKLTGVIKDKNGFNIYKIVGDLATKVLPFEEVKERIKNELVANKIEKSIKDGDFDKIKKKYKIEKFLETKEEK